MNLAIRLPASLLKFFNIKKLNVILILLISIILSACQIAGVESQGVRKLSDSNQQSAAKQVSAPVTKKNPQSSISTPPIPKDFVEKERLKKNESIAAAVESTNSKNTAPKASSDRVPIKKTESKPATTPMIFGAKPKTPKKIPPTKNGLATGTGFFISTDGHLLTNEHVVAQARELKVFVDDTAYEARIVSLNQQDDIAILKIDFKSKPLAIKSSDLLAGTEVSVLGFPNIGIQGNEIKSTFGHVNAASGLKGDQRYFQFSAEIQPGNSGSPVIDEQGYVIGVATSTLNQQAVVAKTGTLAQSVNYALKASYADDLIEKSKVAIPTHIDIITAANRVELVQHVKESVVLIVAAIGKEAKIPETKPKISTRKLEKPPEINSIGGEKQSVSENPHGGVKQSEDISQPINNKNSSKEAGEAQPSKDSHYHFIHFDRK